MKPAVLSSAYDRRMPETDYSIYGPGRALAFHRDHMNGYVGGRNMTNHSWTDLTESCHGHVVMTF